MNSAQGLVRNSGIVDAQLVYGGTGSKMITVLRKDGASNKTYIECSEDRNVVNNQASAPITLDPPSSRVFQIYNHRKAVKRMKKKMPTHVLTPEEKAVEEDLRKAQQANDLAANAKRSSLAGKKSKSNSKRFMGSPKNKSKISAGGQQHKSTAVGKKSYAAAAMSSTPVSPPPTSSPSPPASSAIASIDKKNEVFIRALSLSKEDFMKEVRWAGATWKSSDDSDSPTTTIVIKMPSGESITLCTRKPWL